MMMRLAILVAIVSLVTADVIDQGLAGMDRNGDGIIDKLQLMSERFTRLSLCTMLS